MKLLVPGVHDLAPPEGRLTFELIDERTGRVRHRTQSYNSFTNQFKEALATGLRGFTPNIAASPTRSIGWDPDPASANGAAFGTNTDDSLSELVGTAVPRIVARHYQFCNSLYLSSNSSAVNDDWWFPLGLEAGAALNANNLFTDNKKRGNRQLAMFERRPNLTKYVVDFGTDIANGFSIESAGLAGLRFPNTDGYDGVYGWWTGSALVVSNGLGFGGNRMRSWTKVSPTQIWMLGEDGLSRLQFSNTTWPSGVGDLSGPTTATLGSISGTNSGIAIIGSDFWLMDSLRLRRMDIPTNTSLPTVHNTYSPVTGFTDAACLGLTTDGTSLYAMGSTKVFVINPATGAVTSSWDHNLTGPGGTAGQTISYDETHDILWMNGSINSGNYSRDGFTMASWDPGSYSGDIPFGSGGFSALYPFSKSGTLLGFGFNPWWVATSTAAEVLFTLDSGRLIGISATNTSVGSQRIQVQSGGVLGTRALVSAPFTKTNSEVLRVTYDIEFSTLP